MIKSVFKKHKENKNEYVSVCAREVNFWTLCTFWTKSNFWTNFAQLLDSSTYLVKYFWIILQLHLEDNRRKRGTLKCEMILALKRKIICPKNVKF